MAEDMYSPHVRETMKHYRDLERGSEGAGLDQLYDSIENERAQVWPGTSEKDRTSLLEDIVPQSVKDQQDKENDGRCPTSCFVYWGIDK